MMETTKETLWKEHNPQCGQIFGQIIIKEQIMARLYLDHQVVEKKRRIVEEITELIDVAQSRYDLAKRTDLGAVLQAIDKLEAARSIINSLKEDI